MASAFPQYAAQCSGVRPPSARASRFAPACSYGFGPLKARRPMQRGEAPSARASRFAPACSNTSMVSAFPELAAVCSGVRATFGSRCRVHARSPPANNESRLKRGGPFGSRCRVRPGGYQHFCGLEVRFCVPGRAIDLRMYGFGIPTGRPSFVQGNIWLRQQNIALPGSPRRLSALGFSWFSHFSFGLQTK